MKDKSLIQRKYRWNKTLRSLGLPEIPRGEKLSESDTLPQIVWKLAQEAGAASQKGES